MELRSVYREEDTRLLTIDEAVEEFSFPDLVERLKKAKGGEGYERYKTFIRKRYFLDSKLVAAGIPIEKSERLSDSGKVDTYSAWWLWKKVRDHDVKSWAKEYEKREMRDIKIERNLPGI